MGATPRGHVSITDLPADDVSVKDFFEVILSPNFPPDQLVTMDELRRGMTSGETRASVAWGPDGTMLGGIVGDWFASSRVQLLSYIAVTEASRGQGVGTQLLTAAVDAWVRDLAPALVVGEVEDPHHYRDCRYGDPVARVALYERIGARTLPIPYFQPALAPALSRVRQLLLMVFASHASALTADGRIEGSVVETFLTEYLTQAEGMPADHDSEAQGLLRTCRRAEGLPLVTVAELAQFTS